MRWPWQRRVETRQQSSYTDAIITTLLGKAAGREVALTATGALETCAGLLGRAFTAAEVEAPPAIRRALTPALLTLIGRSMIRRGELLLRIRVEAGRLYLDPVAHHDVSGGYMPETWRYALDLAGPDRTTNVRGVRRDGVVHLMYAADPERPWYGLGPLQVAALAGRLSAETISALADEASGPRGSFLPVPTGGDDPTITALRADIRKSAGEMLTVEAGDFDSADKPAAVWEPKRFGLAPPSAAVELAVRAADEVHGACGVPPSLFRDSQNVSAREGWRLCLHGTIAPLGRLVSAELSRALDAEVTLTWAELRASDLTSRARAFSQMIGRDASSPLIPIDDARRIAGLM